MKFRSGESVSWQPGFWMANIWLVFLVFPILSILSSTQLSTTRQVVGIGILAVFALVHAMGYRVLVMRELGLTTAPTTTGLRRFTDPNRSELWFGLLVATLFVVSATGHHWWLDGIVAIALVAIAWWIDRVGRRLLARVT